MAELLDVMDAFSSPLKLAWGVWLAWGIGQIFWYRQERRASAPGSRPARAARPVPEPRPAPRADSRQVPSARPVPTVPVPTADPGSDAAVTTSEVATSEVPADPAPMGWEAACEAQPAPGPEPEPTRAFDPTQAVVETFGGPAGGPPPENAGDLDDFVASLRQGEPADQERPSWPDA